MKHCPPEITTLKSDHSLEEQYPIPKSRNTNEEIIKKKTIVPISPNAYQNSKNYKHRHKI